MNVDLPQKPEPIVAKETREETAQESMYDALLLELKGGASSDFPKLISDESEVGKIAEMVMMYEHYKFDCYGGEKLADDYAEVRKLADEFDDKMATFSIKNIKLAEFVAYKRSAKK